MLIYYFDTPLTKNVWWISNIIYNHLLFFPNLRVKITWHFSHFDLFYRNHKMARKIPEYLCSIQLTRIRRGMEII